MGSIFLRVLNMSITASWLMAAVILLRFLLKKAPRWISCMLWAFVAIRLVCPFSMESALSLIPSSEPVTEQRMPVWDLQQIFSAQDARKTEIWVGSDAADSVVSESVGASQNSGLSAETAKNRVDSADLFGMLWACGVAILLFYSVISYARLHRRTAVSTVLEGNVWQCDGISTPFVLGIVRPRIYLPSDLDSAQTEYVIAHERVHLKRHDHWWKPLGFLVLSIHWFNPLCWFSYILFCRDMELACDERVIRTVDEPYKKAYAEALLACSAGQKMITASPLTFGEVGVKERIRSIMNYKKPAFWFVLAAAAACAVVAVCFLTNPQKEGTLRVGVQDEDPNRQAGGELRVSSDDQAGDARTNAPGDGTNTSGSEADAAGADGSDADPDDQGSRSDTVEAGAEKKNEDQSEGEHGVPDVVWEQAEQYVQSMFEEAGGQSGRYTEWRVTDAEYCYTYDNIGGTDYEVYRFNYEFLARSPKDIDLAGGMSISEDGWVVPDSPNSHYLVFSKEEEGLSFFCGMYENDCEPGDELFTSDLLNYFNEANRINDHEGWDPAGEELIRRFRQVSRSELRAIPYTQDIQDRDGILCIGELPEEGIRLYGYNDETYWRQGVAVEIRDDIFYFDWGYMTPRVQFPKLYWNEKAQQLQITLPIYTGTGIAAEELIVLQYDGEGVLQPYYFRSDEFTALANSVIGYRFDEESGVLTLIDKRTDEEAAQVLLPGEVVYGVSSGEISTFVLGDTILFCVTPGYLTDGATPQYESMPALEFEVELREITNDGVPSLSFMLGASR